MLIIQEEYLKNDDIILLKTTKNCWPPLGYASGNRLEYQLFVIKVFFIKEKVIIEHNICHDDQLFLSNKPMIDIKMKILRYFDLE